MYCSGLLCLNCRENGGLLIKYNEQLTNIARFISSSHFKKNLIIKSEWLAIY